MPDLAPQPRPRAKGLWPVFVAALVVLVAGFFLLRSILEGTRDGGTGGAKPGEPILGLSDQATKDRNKALHTPVPKASASAAPSSAPPKP